MKEFYIIGTQLIDVCFAMSKKLRSMMIKEINLMIDELNSDDNNTLDGRRKYEFLVNLRDGLRSEYVASTFPDEPM